MDKIDLSQLEQDTLEEIDLSTLPSDEYAECEEKESGKIKNESLEYKAGNMGLDAEEQKMKHRGKVIMFICFIILCLVSFISYLTWLIATRPTFIPVTVYKYFISGVFVNLLVLFKGVTGYLYSNESYSMIKNFFNKRK